MNCLHVQVKAKPVPAPTPTEDVQQPAATRNAQVIADEPVCLRVRATVDGGAKDFNGASVSKGDMVEILCSETTETIEFHYIKAGRKKGFIKAEYLEEM